MRRLARTLAGAGCTLCLCLAVVPAQAQLVDQLAVYGTENAEKYLAPLAEAFGGDLNSGLYYGAYIPSASFQLSFEVVIMATQFNDADRTFEATTEAGFNPQTKLTVPTVVGDGGAITLPGQAGTSFSFPGGFQLNSFAIGVPQLRFGGFRGTEGLVRFFALDTGDAELGNISLWGVQLRHSISQYIGPEPAVDLALSVAYQSFSMGSNDLLETTAFTFGGQASKSFGPLQPFGGFSYNSFNTTLNFESSTSADRLSLEFETQNDLRWNAGLALRLKVLAIFGDYTFGDRNAFSFGLAIGKV